MFYFPVVFPVCPLGFLLGLSEVWNKWIDSVSQSYGDRIGGIDNSFYSRLIWGFFWDPSWKNPILFDGFRESVHCFFGILWVEREICESTIFPFFADPTDLSTATRYLRSYHGIILFSQPGFKETRSSLFSNCNGRTASVFFFFRDWVSRKGWIDTNRLVRRSDHRNFFDYGRSRINCDLRIYILESFDLTFLHHFTSLSNFSLLKSFFWCFWFLGDKVWFTMSQSNLLGKGKTLEMVAAIRKIKIPQFDNTALIAGYSKMVIGRCFNPRMQDMKSLLFMLPRIWQLEGKIVGADLGLGKFQFDFDNEEDIEEVLKNEPFHFDYWMVSMVRWSPQVDPLYPFTLKFWVRGFGVPLQFWADLTFRSIGEEIGKVEAVDIDGGRVQVTVNGFKPLCFETDIEFHSGEETTVTLRYERLFGYCKTCFSLCHDAAHCSPRSEGITIRAASRPEEDPDAKQNQSYKGAVSHNNSRSNAQVSSGQTHGSTRSRSEYQHGETSSRHRRFETYVQYNEYRFKHGLPKAVSHRSTDAAGKKGNVQISETQPPKRVRKALFLEAKPASDQLPVTGEPSQVETQGEIGNMATVEDDLASVITKLQSTFTSEALTTGKEMPQGVMPTDLAEVAEESAEAQVDGMDLMDEVLSSPLNDSHLSNQVMVEDNITEDGDKVVEGSDFIDGEQESEMEQGLLATDEGLVLADPDAETLKEAETEADVETGRKKGILALKGVSSKKRNLQKLATPRKRQAPKASDQHAINPKNQGMEKGNQGATKPPKPTIDK